LVRTCVSRVSFSCDFLRLYSSNFRTFIICLSISVNFALSSYRYEDEPVYLSNGTFVRNQPINLGELESESDEYLSDNKKNDSVIIANAELEYVPRELINDFPNLRKLSIFESIKINDLGSDFFDQGFEKLEAFALFEEKSINALRTDVFINLPNLKELLVMQTTVQELEEGVFRTNKELESVIFDQSKISTIPENLFAGLVNLRSVTFTMSPIKVLPTNLFLGNKSLKQLNFVNTQIGKLPENLLSELFELETFDFGLSQVKAIPENFFKNNGNLKRISLDWNKIEKIPDGTFDGLQKLEKVKLARNTCIDGEFDGKLAVQTMNAELKNCH
jgi:Leucine-rich repeat (LRR) protein